MDNQKKLQEMQFIEQSLHQILLQKQTFQMEQAEVKSALKELASSGDEVYKVVGQLMIKGDKKKTEDELKEKEKFLDLRLKTLEKQESSLTEQLQKHREEIMKSQKKK